MICVRFTEISWFALKLILCYLRHHGYNNNHLVNVRELREGEKKLMLTGGRKWVMNSPGYSPTFVVPYSHPRPPPSADLVALGQCLLLLPSLLLTDKNNSYGC